MTSKLANRRRLPVGRRFCSTAYGLVIGSDFELPEFSQTEGDADVEVWLNPPSPACDCATLSWDFGRASATCCFPQVGTFQITAGREICITPVAGVDPSFLRLYVEGMMMAIILYQRGSYVLHSSLVKIGNIGAAFVGSVGAGKSSTAMALHTRGHMVVTDDNAGIAGSLAHPRVIPSFPRIKLYPAIAKSLGLLENSLEDLHSSQIKKTRSVAENFPVDAVPLDRIYCLTKNGPDVITQLSMAEAVIELIKVSVPGRWGLSGDIRHFQDTAQLARTVPVYRIRTFDSLESLPLLADRIEDHCGFTRISMPMLNHSETQEAMSHAG